MLLSPYRFGTGAGSDPNWLDVGLLLRLNGNFTDSSSSPKTTASVGGLATTIAAAKFGEGVQCAAGQYITVAANDDLRFNGQFTFEFWMRATNVGGGAGWNQTYFFSTVSQSVFIQNNNGSPEVRFHGSTLYVNLDMSGNTAWHHIAITRDASNVVRLFWNGEQRWSLTNAGSDESATGWEIGGLTTVAGAAYAYLGKLDEIRFTKGVCRYAADFTPPSAEFPNV